MAEYLPEVKGPQPGKKWANNKEMCDYGVQQLRAGKCDALEFRVAIQLESDYIHKYMEETYPGTPFRTVPLRWKDKEKG